jgi:hypothetical protein
MIGAQDPDEEVSADKEDLAIGIVTISVWVFVSPLALKLVLFLVTLVTSCMGFVFAFSMARNKTILF